MKRIVIAIGNRLDYDKKCQELKWIEEIFTRLGKLISENEVVITYGNCYNKKSGISLPEIVNAYDQIKYRYGYSKDAIAVLTRAEIDNKSYSSSVKTKNSSDGDMHINENAPENLEIEEFTSPVDIPEKSAIMTLVSDGYLPFVAGTEFPVIRELHYYNECHGIVNNYSFSSLLATLLEADEFLIISQYNDESGEAIADSLTSLKNIKFAALMDIYKNHQFKGLSTDLKIKAMLDFISKGGKKATFMLQNMDVIITLKP